MKKQPVFYRYEVVICNPPIITRFPSKPDPINSREAGVHPLRWRKWLQAYHKILWHYGIKAKDLVGIEALFAWNTPTIPEEVEAVEHAFASNKRRNFAKCALWDWSVEKEEFIPVRPFPLDKK